MQSTSTKKVSPNVSTASNSVDCSDEDISYEALARINEYFQVNRMAMPEFEYFKKGPDHIPMFTCQTTYNDTLIQATAQTKKDAEKKVKSYIWFGFITNPTSKHTSKSAPQTKVNTSLYSTIPHVSHSEGASINASILSNNFSRVGTEAAPSRADTESSRLDSHFEKAVTRSASPSSAKGDETKVVDYTKFKDVLVNFGANKQSSTTKRPVLFLDLTSVEMSESDEKRLEENCPPGTILFVEKERKPWKNSVVIICKENDTITNGVINRIVYYLIDSKSQEKILLVSDRELKSLEKCCEKTGQKVIVKPSLKEIFS